MRLVTIRTADGTSAGRLDGDRVVPLDAPDVAAVLAAGADNIAQDFAGTRRLAFRQRTTVWRAVGVVGLGLSALMLVLAISD